MPDGDAERLAVPAPSGARCTWCDWTGGPEALTGYCPKCGSFLERVPPLPRVTAEPWSYDATQA